MAIVRTQHKYLWGLTGNHAPDSRQKACKMPVCPRVLLFLWLPGSLAFCIHSDYSCKSRPRQGSSKSIVFHTMAPVMGAFSVAIPFLLQGLEFLLASAGSHEHSSFIPHPCFCPSALCPPSAEAENTSIEETNSTQNLCDTNRFLLLLSRPAVLLCFLSKFSTGQFRGRAPQASHPPNTGLIPREGCKRREIVQNGEVLHFECKMSSTDSCV